MLLWRSLVVVFFFQAEDGIRDLVRSRGLGDVYKRQQYRVMVMGDLSESQAKIILLKYQKAGWAKQGKIQSQSERGE